MPPERSRSDARVGAKLRELTAIDPLGRLGPDDPWSAFRRVEVIDLQLNFSFRHSLGKYSRFFLELEHRRLMATRCPRCGSVWMPPRPACGNDLAVTEWIELSGRGTLAAATECAYTLTTGGGAARLVLGYVALDGASTLLLQQIRNYRDVRRLTAGLPIRVVWADEPVRHPMELFWFEPAG
jgi:uncharacterized OB-fold protein